MVLGHVQEGLRGHSGARDGVERFQGLLRLRRQPYVLGRVEEVLGSDGEEEEVVGEVVTDQEVHQEVSVE